MTSRVRYIGLAAALLGACSVPARPDAAASPEIYEVRRSADPALQLLRLGLSLAVGPQRLVVLVANDAYVLRVSPPCAQLQFALDIRLSTAIRGTVSGYDYVVFDDQKCLIDEIRQVDERRMHQDAAQESG